MKAGVSRYLSESHSTPPTSPERRISMDKWYTRNRYIHFIYVAIDLLWRSLRHGSPLDNLRVILIAWKLTDRRV
jgi:hypothetical protein